MASRRVGAGRRASRAWSGRGRTSTARAASASGHRGRALARHGEEEERRLEEGAGKRAAGWARMATAAARQRARSSDGGRQGAVRVRDVVREGVFYKCALNLRLNK